MVANPSLDAIMRHKEAIRSYLEAWSYTKQAHLKTARFMACAGRTGLFCPCVLFGRNYEKLRDDTPWTTPCICHAIFVEGGMALAAGTAIFHGINPDTTFLICEGLLFSWWMCGIYTGFVRQTLQKKYHLKVSSKLPFRPCVNLLLFVLKKKRRLKTS